MRLRFLLAPMLRLLPLVLLTLAACGDASDAPIATNADRARTLIAQAQAAHASDSLEWCPPVVLFQRDRLQRSVRR